MVDVIGANFLRGAVDKAPTALRKHIQVKVFAVPGISLHPTAKYPKKQLTLSGNSQSLKNRSNIVIWHNLLNNSLFPLKSNGYRRSTPEKVVEILEPFRKQLSALVYNQRIGTASIQKHLITAKFLTIHPRQHLLSNHKKKNQKKSQELLRFHSKEFIELHLLQIILRHEGSLGQLLGRNRSKIRKKGGDRNSRRRLRSGFLI